MGGQTEVDGREGAMEEVLFSESTQGLESDSARR